MLNSFGGAAQRSRYNPPSRSPPDMTPTKNVKYEAIGRYKPCL